MKAAFIIVFTLIIIIISQGKFKLTYLGAIVNNSSKALPSLQFDYVLYLKVTESIQAGNNQDKDGIIAREGNNNLELVQVNHESPILKKRTVFSDGRGKIPGPHPKRPSNGPSSSENNDNASYSVEDSASEGNE